MPSLISLRDEIMRGDLRALYLGWLASCASADRGVEDDEIAAETQLEPPVPPGLATLSAPLAALADFLRVDDELIQVASRANGGQPPAEPSRDQVALWLKKLPAADKEGYLLRLIDGEKDIPIRAELSLRFREETTPKTARTDPDPGRRTLGQLLEARDHLAAENKRKADEKAAGEKAARDRKRDEERARHLDRLAGREAETWREVRKLVATTVQGNYDRAIELLVDLRDLARRDGRVEEVEGRIRELRRDYRRKPSLMERLDKEKLGL